VFGRHGGDDDVQPLLASSRRSRDAPVVFQPRLGLEAEVGAERRAQFVAVEIDYGNISVGETVTEALRERGLARAGAAEKQKTLVTVFMGKSWGIKLPA